MHISSFLNGHFSVAKSCLKLENAPLTDTPILNSNIKVEVR